MKKVIHTDNAPKAIGPYSQAYDVNGVLYCSGQVPLSPTTGEVVGSDITEQTEQACQNITAVLKEAGYTFDDVIKTTCFLTTMEHFAGFNAVYEKYFTSKPPRSCVAVHQLPKDVFVEIEIIATKA